MKSRIERRGKKRKPPKSCWIEKFTTKQGKSYRVRWRMADGTKKSETFPNKRLALKFKDKKEKELHSAIHGLRQEDDATLREFAKSYFSSATFLEKGDRTRNGFEMPTINEFSILFGDWPLPLIQAEQLETYKTGLYKKGYARNTIGGRLRALNTFFNHALIHGKIEKNPFPPRFIPGYESTAIYREEWELKLFFEDLQEHHDLVFRACHFDVYVGLRRAELLGLGWNKVLDVTHETEGNSIPYRLMIIERPGNYRRTTKVKKRTVYIPPAAWAFMGAHKGAGQVFEGLTATALNHQMLKACRRINKKREKDGLPAIPNITPHHLRHTWATNYMIENGDLAGLMLTGGWDSLKAVEIYQHLARGRSQSIFRVKYPTLAHLAPILPQEVSTTLVDHKSKEPLPSTENGSL